MRYRRLSCRYTGLVSGLGVSSPANVWSGSVRAGFAHRQWQPPADLYENPMAVIVKVEIAGMADEDLEISLYENALLIEGMRSWETLEGETQYHAINVHYGSFRLEVPLSQRIDLDRVQARYERGFLYVTLPKAEVES
jgi:HSP20 family molecular chaperone IbpA